MRYSAAEKREIIHMVEHSDLSIRQTLEEMEVPRSSFYRWYRRFQEDGLRGLETKSAQRKRFWKRIPESVREQVVELALEYPDQSSRQLAWQFTDQQGDFISESSVYRILKGYDLLENPAFEIIPVKEKFDKPTRRVNEMWQTDFTQFKIVGWGWYYLSTVLDDYSRYIIAWKLTTTMNAKDVQATLEAAQKKAGIEKDKVRHRPRLLSDNGPCYLSRDLKAFLDNRQMQHIRSAPYHPMTLGKIERYHRSMKNVVKLRNYYYPWELAQAIEAFVEYYNHEALDNLTPPDVYSGRSEEVLTHRELIKHETLQNRKRFNLKLVHVKSRKRSEKYLLENQFFCPIYFDDIHQGKIERYHRSLKNIVKLQHYYSPSELRDAIADFVDYYNNQRYHESLDNMTHADVFYGKEKEVKTKREKIKQETMALRRQQNLIPSGV